MLIIPRRFLSAVSASRSRLSPEVQRSVPAYYLRGGTSKGVFIPGSTLQNLDDHQREETLLHLMGSPDPEYGRQLNGMGGGISSLSKIVVVEPHHKQDDAHVRYKFIQVGIKDSVLDESGNCGNLSSMVGAYALWTRMTGKHGPDIIQGEDGIYRATVRALNTNTNKRVATTFPVVDRDGMWEPVLDLPEVEMAGVPGRASRITLDFLRPAGAATGKLLPSGSSVDTVSMPDGQSQIRVSLVDATNPTVFVHLDDLQHILMDNTIDYSSTATLHTLEHIRREAAKLMGLNPDVQAQPKISILSCGDGTTDVVAHTLSMGVLHKAIPMTVGLCLGVAARMRGTIPANLVEQTHAGKGNNKAGSPLTAELVRIRHPGGTAEVGADFGQELSGRKFVRSAKVVRTGKRLMSGKVWL